MASLDRAEALDVAALQIRRQHAANKLEALQQACASTEQELIALDAAIARKRQDASASTDQLQPLTTTPTDYMASHHMAPARAAADGGSTGGDCASSSVGRPSCDAPSKVLAASSMQKRHKVEGFQAATGGALEVLQYMARNHLLPKAAWGICRFMHREVRPYARLVLEEQSPPDTTCQAFSSKTIVHLELRGSFDRDPLLALSLSPPASSAAAREGFDRLFSDVKVMTLHDLQGTLTRAPASLQEMHVVDCNPTEVLRILRSVLRATDSGPQADVLTLVKSFATDVGGMQELPDLMGDLSSLLRLELCHCELLANLPNSICSLTTLTALDLEDCAQLTALPDSIGQLRALTSLRLTRCEQLVSLPDSVGDLTALKQLELRHFNALQTLPSSIGRLAALTVLRFHHSVSLESLPDSIDALAALTTLKLSCNRALTGLPDSIVNLVTVTKLDLRICRQLASLPESIGKMTALSQLLLGRCSHLQQLPESIGELQALELLDLDQCSALTCLPQSIGNMSALKSLSLPECTQLTALPDSIGNLKSLRNLNLRECTALSCLPDSMGHLGALVCLNLRYCSGLVSLPTTIGQLAPPQYLDVDGCCELVRQSAAALVLANPSGA